MVNGWIDQMYFNQAFRKRTNHGSLQQLLKAKSYRSCVERFVVEELVADILPKETLKRQTRAACHSIRLWTLSCRSCTSIMKSFSVTDWWIGCRYFTQSDLEATNRAACSSSSRRRTRSCRICYRMINWKFFLLLTGGLVAGISPKVTWRRRTEQLAAAAAGWEQEAVAAALEW